MGQDENFDGINDSIGIKKQCVIKMITHHYEILKVNFKKKLNAFKKLYEITYSLKVCFIFGLFNFRATSPIKMIPLS